MTWSEAATLSVMLVTPELAQLTCEWHPPPAMGQEHAVQGQYITPSPGLVMSQLLPQLHLWTRPVLNHLHKLELLDPEASHAGVDAHQKEVPLLGPLAEHDWQGDQR